MGFIQEKIIWPFRYRRAVREADRRAHRAKCNQYVIVFRGRFLVMSRREIETAVARRVFRKGVRPAAIRRMAIYVATNH